TNSSDAIKNKENYKKSQTLLGIPIEQIKYMICQVEKGENEGTSHLQGYVEYNTNIRFKRFKKEFNSRMHLETRKSSREAAIEYCSKNETRIRGPYEFGDRNLRRTMQGDRKRTIIEIQQRINNRARKLEIGRAHV